jgi:putative membrane-bound dehydrogenase-like protein
VTNRPWIWFVALAPCFWGAAVSAANSTGPTAPGSLPLSAHIHVRSGFHLEIVASAPLVSNPVALAFDADGRLFVAESAGRIRLLEDTQGAGVFDSSTIYADGVKNPSALICYGGGVFVAAGAEILFLKDTRGSGVADVRRVVFSGFGESNDRLNPASSFTSLAWGPDNRIHVGATGGPGNVISSSQPRESLVLTAGDFSFDPRTFQLFDDWTVAPAGLCFDNSGREFVCASNHPVAFVMAEAAVAPSNPVDGMSNLVLDTCSGAASRIYRWRAGIDAPPAPPLPLSDPAGLVIYRGAAFGMGEAEDAFVTDASLGIIHHLKLATNGIELIASRPLGEAASEIVAGDASFQPLQIVNGPDGSLYVADLAPAGDGGRIWRLLPDAFKPSAVPRLSRLASSGLVAALLQPNGWENDTAARLIYERQDQTAAAPLVMLLLDPDAPPLARLRALDALDGLRVLAEPHILKAFRDPDERVRLRAVFLSAHFATNGIIPDRMWSQLQALAGDPSISVRYQLAVTLGQLREPDRITILAAILRLDPANRWIQSAVLDSAGPDSGSLFALLADDPSFRNSDVGAQFLSSLATAVGEQNQPDSLQPVLQSVAGLPELPLAFRFLRALNDGLLVPGSSVLEADPSGILNPLSTRAVNFVAQSDAANPALPDEIRTLGLVSAGNVIDPLFNLIIFPQPDPIQTAAISALGNLAGADISSGLIQRYLIFKPDARAGALAVLLSTTVGTSNLLSVLESHVIDSGDLCSPQVRFLLNHPDPDLRARGRALFTGFDGSRDQQALAQFQPALQLSGDPGHGRELFLARCADCHQIAGTGNPSGVDLAAAAGGSRADLLAKILAPPAEPRLASAIQVIETTGGETFIGFVPDPTANPVAINQVDGATRKVSRHNISSITFGSGTAMPDGFGTGQDPQAVADLLEFLSQSDPAK